jgi:outer membrane protein assembly factor BamA
MLFDIKEARRWTFNYGFGFEVQTGSEPNSNLPQGRTGISPRVSFDLTRINFRGRNHTLLFTSHIGRLEQRALFTYEAPRWFDHQNLTFSFISFYDNTNDIRTFTSERLEGAFQVEHRWSRATTFLYRFSYRKVRATNLVIDPLLVPLYSTPVRIGMPSFTYVRDTRDNPLDSKRGDYTTVDTGVSAKAFGSQASFARFLIQNSTYHPFNKGRIVLARSIRLGVEHPLANTSTPQGVIPLPELLFAGGGNSHRGFSINQAGPRDLDTGFPLGGQAMFINNLELRLPPPWLPVIEDKVSPVLFYDMGNVFASPSDMFHSFLKTGQNNLQDCRPKMATDPASFVPTCDFSFMSHAVGGGFRYNTPIGPVRLDFGYNLNPPTFLVQRENTVQVLRRFNFFFSIGQTF